MHEPTLLEAQAGLDHAARHALQFLPRHTEVAEGFDDVLEAEFVQGHDESQGLRFVINVTDVQNFLVVHNVRDYVFAV